MGPLCVPGLLIFWQVPGMAELRQKVSLGLQPRNPCWRPQLGTSDVRQPEVQSGIFRTGQ